MLALPASKGDATQHVSDGPPSDPFGSGRLGRDLITEWRVFVALTEVQGQPKSACHACGVGF